MNIYFTDKQIRVYAEAFREGMRYGRMASDGKHFMRRVVQTMEKP